VIRLSGVFTSARICDGLYFRCPTWLSRGQISSGRGRLVVSRSCGVPLVRLVFLLWLRGVCGRRLRGFAFCGAGAAGCRLCGLRSRPGSLSDVLAAANRTAPSRRMPVTLTFVSLR
jgi:hypothetical protein